jgi:imidazolonepropionase-like amidohydrolase
MRRFARIAAVLAACTALAPVHAETVVVTAAHMVDVLAGKEVDRPQVTIVDGRIAAGVKMLFGTDGGVYPNGDNGKQFAKMVEWGMTPIEAIQAATRSAAEALDRTRDVGAIAVGRYGDMVAVDGDPLQDVRLLEHPSFVMKGGEVVKD